MGYYKRVTYSLMGLVGCSLLLCSCKPPEPTSSEQTIRPVRYQQVFSKGGIGQSRSFAGISQTGIEIKLGFQVAGTVDKILAKAGDKVRTKQMIALLEATEYQQYLHKMEDALADAQKLAQDARKHYDQVRQLYDQNMNLQGDLDIARNFAEQARNEVRLASKELQTARTNHTHTRLLSPQACQIKSVFVEVNQKVEAGEPAFSIVCGEQIQVQVAMSAALLSNVHQGHQVKVFFEAMPERQFSGKVVSIADEPIGQTQRYAVMVQLKESDRRLRPHLAAEVEFQLNMPNKRPVILVPTVAVGEDEEGRFVYIVEKVTDDGLGVVRRREVEIGRLTEEGLEVLSGLQSGERVVTAGFSQLKEGLTVRFPEQSKHYHSETGDLSHTIYLILAHAGDEAS
ncbi:efflux RND transporter periplasmic adaptor subunit [Candidatus Albibeggiatoa sp. nov. NOAA]|uniref:efflux RND transporter periplasmic adaptor subunit n=1 Tax=Candidatus Albibeggiatoa sp. nov. NOAA TaxID=3162724 RepID=UPI0032F85503|nr:efflux RND transporter periplasmic adaptor subunit [Thiotrichaceae bacterium]